MKTNTKSYIFGLLCLIHSLIFLGVSGQPVKAEGNEQLTNPSFDDPNGASWEVTDAPGVNRDIIFAQPGEANLHGSFRGPLIWQELDLVAQPGLILRAGMTLASGFFPEDQSTAVFLDYTTRGGSKMRIPLFSPDNNTVGSKPQGTGFTHVFEIPTDAYKITRFSVDRAGPGEFWALEFSLKPIGAVIPISTVEELQKIGHDANYPMNGWYELTGNIDAGESVGWNEWAGFLPIGGTLETPIPFTGIFNGNGYQIHGLVIHQPTLQKVGLFREVSQSAIIREVGMVGGEIGGAGLSGALAGFNAGTVERCFAKSMHVVGQYFGGGLVGESEGVVRDSFARGSVNSYMRAGGLVGIGMNATIENCFAASVLQPWGIQWGQFDSLAGMWSGPGSYGDGDVASSANGVWVEGFTTVEMTYPYGEGIYTDWDFDGTWIADIDKTLNDGYPFLRSAMKSFAGGLGTADFPFLVATAEQLDRVRHYGWAHFRQIADIDLGVAPWNVGEGWVPMLGVDGGTGQGGFAGVYDGGGYAVRNIFHAENAGFSGGLFGAVLGRGALRNINMEGGVIGRRFSDAAALASMNSGLIEDCTVSTRVAYSYEMGGGMVVMNDGMIRNSTFSGTVDGGHWVGGIAAKNGGTIENSHCTGVVGANYHSIGGVAGVNEGLIRHCSVTGAIASTIDPMSGGDLEFSYAAGGLVGENHGVIDQSHSSASVDGRGNVNYMSHGTGGLVGQNTGHIKDSFATGNVIGQKGVGGLVGENAEGWTGESEDVGTIERTYSTGAVSGVNAVGGLVGSNTGNVTTSYWNTNASGVVTSAGGESRGTDAMTYPYAADTYVGWDFANTWVADMDGTINGGYPYLRGESSGVTTFTVSYMAGNGGSMAGQATQMVEANGSGTEVIAVPDTGAVFDRWSDGVPTAARTESNVQSNVEVTALFRSEGGVGIDWYAGYNISPGLSQTWAELDGKDRFGKGMTLSEEFLANTDPNDPLSRFVTGAPVRAGSAVEIHFQPSLPDRRYTLWRSVDFADWSPVPGQVNVPGGNGPLVDDAPPAGNSFYKVGASLP